MTILYRLGRRTDLRIMARAESIVLNQDLARTNWTSRCNAGHFSRLAWGMGRGGRNESDLQSNQEGTQVGQIDDP